MILPIHQQLRRRVREVLEALYQLTPEDLPSLVIEVPPRRALGDLALPLAFDLARRLRRPPRAIAQELAGAVGPLDGVARIEAAPNGYLNVFLDRAGFLRSRLVAGPLADRTPAAWTSLPRDKTIVEHTAINPNKAAHIGHLRNATLGDTLVRMLRFCGVPVETQNYIDDTGVQVADVVVGFLHLEGRTPADVRALAETTRFDHYCWDLYARVTDWYLADPSRGAVRAQVLHAIEHGEGEAAELGAFIADHIVRCHLRTMARLNVDYDLLTWEGDILRLHFWATAFDILKANGSVFLQHDGPLAGCWVMRIDDALAAGEERPEEPDDAEVREKVIVRSNGTVTYVGKDIANQFWKFGLLGRDFRYRPFATARDGHVIYATTSDEHGGVAGRDGIPEFGRARAVYNVIDSRQAYLQRLLRQALFTMGHRAEAERSVHFSYEMVALSHATARELGYDTAAAADKPFVEVSGRKGLGVKADDLIDRLVARATEEVTRRNPDLDPEERRVTAERIAVAALRYFMVKFSRSKIIAFDINDALSFEGETGPYLQYAVVRAANIFAKLKARDGIDEAAIVAALPDTSPTALTEGQEGDELWNLAFEASRLDEMVEQAVRSLEPSLLAKYVFGLAQAFNAAYHRYPILNEPDESRRRWRAAVTAYFRRQMTRALDVLGCEVPTRM